MSSASRTATFLFTDMENSTPLWENHPDLMPVLGARHDALVRGAIEGQRGRVVKTMGDGFHAMFDSASDCAMAAVAAQQALEAESWPGETGPIHVRMGLHTGESEFRDGDYYGTEVNRAARVMAIAHGGQIVLTDPTAALIRKALPPETSLTDLGQHRLKGIAAPEQIYQLCHPSLPADFPPLKSLSTYQHNLPVQLNTFVGREKELAQVERLLHETHLLTLLGPGGTGKTRLMLQAAEEVVDEYHDGVWLVELAPLTDPALIPGRVAAALNVDELPGRELRDTLAEYLRRKEILLLIDNVEHMVRESAELSQYLLERCPRLKMLVTGREALFIEGETTLQIPSLSLPHTNGEGPGQQAHLDEVRASEGVELFLMRARAVKPDFEVTSTNAAAIAEIVRRLDGIPLALELAAARLRMLTVEQIAARLNDRFRLLTGGRRTALPRQQTLQALIDWSWNLLEENERILLRRLSVFSGGWSLEAAQAVAADDQAGSNQLDEFDVFDGLEGLINKSQVRVREHGGAEARYAMLESIRQYARDRLFEAGEGEALRDRHAGYFVDFALQAERTMFSSTTVNWPARIRQEMDNLRSVMTWTLEDRPEIALQIAGALLRQDFYVFNPREASSWLEPAIEKTRESVGLGKSAQVEDLAKALQALATMRSRQGRESEARELLRESIVLAGEIGNHELLAFGIAWSAGLESRLGALGVSAETQQELDEAIMMSREEGLDLALAWLLFISWAIQVGQRKIAEAERYFQEALQIIRKINNPYLNAIALAARAGFATAMNNLDEAKELYVQVIENSKALNERSGAVRSMSDLAHLYRREWDLEEAEGYYRETIVIWQEQGHRSAVAHQLECFAYIAIARGQYNHAARLLGAATEARERLDAVSTDPQELAELTEAMDQLTGAMGEGERDRVLAEGRLIDLDDAVLLALDEKVP
jgi:predicted ATPase/class 3 adenylate cyclase